MSVRAPSNVLLCCCCLIPAVCCASGSANLTDTSYEVGLCMYVWMRVCMCLVSACLSVCLSVCVCLCVCLFEPSLARSCVVSFVSTDQNVILIVSQLSFVVQSILSYFVQLSESGASIHMGQGGHVPQYLDWGDIITNVPLNISRVISATFYPCNIFLIS